MLQLGQRERSLALGPGSNWLRWQGNKGQRAAVQEAAAEQEQSARVRVALGRDTLAARQVRQSRPLWGQMGWTAGRRQGAKAAPRKARRVGFSARAGARMAAAVAAPAVGAVGVREAAMGMEEAAAEVLVAVVMEARKGAGLPPPGRTISWALYVCAQGYAHPRQRRCPRHGWRMACPLWCTGWVEMGAWPAC